MSQNVRNVTPTCKHDEHVSLSEHTLMLHGKMYLHESMLLT